MNKQLIRVVQAYAKEAIRYLDEAEGLEYCSDFKNKISEAADLLENAAKELRAMEGGKR